MIVGVSLFLCMIVESLCYSVKHVEVMGVVIRSCMNECNRQRNVSEKRRPRWVHL